LKKNEFNLFNRIAAALLAFIWLVTGLGVIALGIIYKHWVIALPGLLAAWYGLIWGRAAIEGRRLPWPAGLFPWRR
jgi:hypothetical protein